MDIYHKDIRKRRKQLVPCFRHPLCLLFDYFFDNSVPVLIGNLFNLIFVESDALHFFNDIWYIRSILKSDGKRSRLAAERAQGISLQEFRKVKSETDMINAHYFHHMDKMFYQVFQSLLILSLIHIFFFIPLQEEREGKQC